MPEPRPESYFEVKSLEARARWPHTFRLVLAATAHAARALDIAQPRIHFFFAPDPARLASLAPQVRARLDFEPHETNSPSRVIGEHPFGSGEIWIRLGGPGAQPFRAAAVAAHEVHHAYRHRQGAATHTDEEKRDDERAADAFARRVMRELGYPIAERFKEQKEGAQR